jgi:hypothetical protein
VFRFTIRDLLWLTVAVAVALGLLRAVMVEPEPYWGLYLLGLTSVCSGTAAIIIARFDRPINPHRNT